MSNRKRHFRGPDNLLPRMAGKRNIKEIENETGGYAHVNPPAYGMFCKKSVRIIYTYIHIGLGFLVFLYTYLNFD